jgi:hypothetical protein
MQQNMLLLQSVNACCRLPFLRHTPLKELYRLAKYLNEVKYSQGDIILHQVHDVCELDRSAGSTGCCLLGIVVRKVPVVLSYLK